jgi:hypothetical protein
MGQASDLLTRAEERIIGIDTRLDAIAVKD